MDLRLAPITVQSALDFIAARGIHQPVPPGSQFAISAASETLLHGVIIMNMRDDECSLVYLYTDGTALVGSLLYGAAWRAAKALGYKQITI